ncbi:MAG: PIN domain-containing protein [Verrucomicrobiae bacterium]|nr:PIN domain-containing protein [Verrucomicrobiae bacterium]
MSTGLDCNILVQLAMEDHQLHERSVRGFEQEAAADAVFALIPLVATEFLHVVTDAKRFDKPRNMVAALNWLNSLLARPEVEVMEIGSEDLRLTQTWLAEFHLGRKRILDTLLAATLHRHGVRRLLTSNPDDFRVFGVFDLVVP